MREPALIRLLPDGRRLHLHDGPIDLIIEARGSKQNVAAAYEGAARRFVSVLDELCCELPLLRSQARENSSRPKGIIAQRMFDAVTPYAELCFITPMAAVAGAVAEEVLASMTAAAPLERAYVNDGGDIAIYLAPQQCYRVGVVERPDRPSLFGALELSSSDAVRGIATSGWRGRSFSLGIADAVTVLAETAAAADAAATVIANAVNLPGHPAILRIPAHEISPDSDLGDLLVTCGVGPLLRFEISLALECGAQTAESLRKKKVIHSAALSLQGHVRVAAPEDSFCRDGFLRKGITSHA